MAAARVTHTEMPLARNISTSSGRFSSELAMTSSGRSASMSATLGYFEPPTLATARSAGWTQ